MTTGIIIQARTTSSRFPSKVIAPLCGKPLLDHMIKTCKSTSIPYCIAIPVNHSNDAFAQWCKERDYNFFRGSEDDCTDRFLRCAEDQKYDTIVRVCADAPLIQRDDITEAISRFTKTSRFTEGNMCQVFSTEMLRDAWVNDPYAERRVGVSFHHMGNRLDYPEDLARIERAMMEGKNYMEEMRKNTNESINTLDIIEKSYDLQAGISSDREREKSWSKVYDDLAKLINKHIEDIDPKTILDAGCGEGNILGRLYQRLGCMLYGLDISAERIKHAQQQGFNIWKSSMEKIDYPDSFFDLVYTVHAIEPNGGFAPIRIIKELLRVTKKRLVLIEPDYEGGNQATKDNIDKHHYVKGIADILKYSKLDYKYTFLGIGKTNNQNAMYVIDK